MKGVVSPLRYTFVTITIYTSLSATYVKTEAPTIHWVVLRYKWLLTAVEKYKYSFLAYHIAYRCNQMCSDIQGAVWVLFSTMNSLPVSQFSCNIFVTKLDTKPLLNQHSASSTRLIPKVAIGQRRRCNLSSCPCNNYECFFQKSILMSSIFFCNPNFHFAIRLPH